MRIIYYNNSNGATGARAIHEKEYADGLDPWIAATLSVDKEYVKEDALKVAPEHRAWARAKDGVDEYNEEIGRCVARDKVLVKYYEKTARAQEAYIEALKKELTEAERKCELSHRKVANAKARLENY